MLLMIFQYGTVYFDHRLDVGAQAERDAFRSTRTRTRFGVVSHRSDQLCAVTVVNADVKLLETPVGMFGHHSIPRSWPDVRVEVVWQREKHMSRD